MPLQKLALVLGGAASGKSAYAESLVEALDRSKVYLATAEAWDVEMKTKIQKHRERRDAGWRTVETPRDAAGVLRDIPPTEVVLLDCATLWLTNQMLADADLNAEEDRLLQALGDCRAPVVVVSNEIGLGLVPDNALGRRFRDAQGRLNQRLAAQADLVVFVAAGLPFVLKGSLA